jgi:hypothetical protein
MVGSQVTVVLPFTVVAWSGLPPPRSEATTSDHSEQADRGHSQPAASYASRLLPDEPDSAADSAPAVDSLINPLR